MLNTVMVRWKRRKKLVSIAKGIRRVLMLAIIISLVSIIIKGPFNNVSITGMNIFKQNDYPPIAGEAAITIDPTTNKIIYAKNIHRMMYPASTTKLITAILLAENKTPGSILTYSSRAKSQEANKQDLAVGSQMSAENAMDAMLLFSANDIAYMIAENVAGSNSKFANKMNEKAVQLGLKNTNFVTPNGLHNDNHFTTPYELGVIAKEIYKYPWIIKTLQKRTSEINVLTPNPQGRAQTFKFTVENTNLLLGIDGNIGGKTGFTTPAGKVLVAFYERNGKKMIGIVMKSNDDNTVMDDMNTIINWSFEQK